MDKEKKKIKLHFSDDNIGLMLNVALVLWRYVLKYYGQAVEFFFGFLNKVAHREW